MKFTITEKLAISRMLHEMIIADWKVETNEILYLTQVMQVIWINDDIMEQSREISLEEVIMTIRMMNKENQWVLLVTLKEMIDSDWDVHEEEIKLLNWILIAAEIDLNNL